MRGYTLVELLACLLIVALLSAIALPGYRGVVLRAHRNEARLALLGIQAQQERDYIERHRYTDTLAATQSEGGRYELAITLSDDGQRYVARAQPHSGSDQAQDSACTLLSINESGDRTASSEACWR